MTTTPLPSYGIWTADMEGNRVMGFTPEQFLSVWQARADLEAENQRLREALEGMLEYSGIIEERCDCIATNAARAALKGSNHD